MSPTKNITVNIPVQKASTRNIRSMFHPPLGNLIKAIINEYDMIVNKTYHTVAYFYLYGKNYILV